MGTYDRRPELDDRDHAIIASRLAAFDEEPDVRVGDYVDFADGVSRRVSHVFPREWGDDYGVQTSDGGSFYLDEGFVSFSGSLYPPGSAPDPRPDGAAAPGPRLDLPSRLVGSRERRRARDLVPCLRPLRGGTRLIMNTEGRAEGARELILAIFRLAVADYLGVSYDYDEPVRQRCVRSVYTEDAEAFLQSLRAAALADLIALSSGVIWRETRRLQRDRDRSSNGCGSDRGAAGVGCWRGGKQATATSTTTGATT